MLPMEQGRARFALEKVESVCGRGDRAKYKTQLLKLPARLHTNGLGQTVAFYLAAGAESPEARICGWLEDWLGRRKIYGERPLIDSITGRGEDDDSAIERRYRIAAAEARALAVWLKKFAEAFIAEPQPGNGR